MDENNNVERMERLMQQILDLYRRKNHDYGNSFGNIANQLNATLGQQAKCGYMFGHILEKANRIVSVAGDGTQVGESANDSLIDIACYALMTYLEINQDK